MTNVITKVDNSPGLSNTLQIVVDKNGGGQFTTIKDACAYASNLSIAGDSQITILVKAGSYNEDNSSGAISVAGHVSIVGETVGGVNVSPSTNTNTLFTDTTNGAVTFDSIQFTNNTNGAAIVSVNNAGSPMYVRDCTFSGNLIDISITGSGQVYCYDTFSTLSGTFGSVTGAGSLIAFNCMISSATTAAYRANGNAAGIFVFGGESVGCGYVMNIDGNSDTTGFLSGHIGVACTNGLRVDDGAILLCNNVSLLQTSTTALTQASASSVVLWNGGTFETDKSSIAGVSAVHYSGYDFTTGNAPFTRVIYNSSSTWDAHNDLISVTTAATQTLPGATSVVAAFPIKFSVFNEHTALFRLEAPAGGTINGAASYSVGAKSFVVFYGTGNTWFAG